MVIIYHSMGIDNSHKAIINEHLEACLTDGVPLDQIHRELVEIFSQTNRYTLQQITAATSWLRSEILKNKRTASGMDFIATSSQTHEDVDFNNPAKNESREWHMANIARHISLEQRKNMRFSLLPGQNDYDFRALQEIGISCRNMVTFILGEDPKATAEYVRMCRRYEIGDRRIGEMGSILPTMDKPIDGIYWDYFGQVCPAYICHNWSLPIEPNSAPIPIGVNVMKGREHKSTVRALLTTAYIALETAKNHFKDGKRVHTWEDSLKLLHSDSDPSEFEGLDLSTARNDFLQGSFLHRVGVANTKNWLLPEHARKVIEIFLNVKNSTKTFEELSEVEKYSHFEEGMAFMSLICRQIDEELFEGKSPMTVPMELLSSGTAMGLVNRPIIQASEEPMEYKSAHKNRPFVSIFGIIQTKRRHYEHQIPAMEFLLNVMTHYTPIFWGREHGGLDRKDCIGIFEVTGAGAKKEVVYRDASRKIITSIRHDALLEAVLELSISKSSSMKGQATDEGFMTNMRENLESISDMADFSESVRLLRIEYEEQGYRQLDLKGVPFQNGNGKINRNDPCPCGSGNKFKKCCMRDH